MIAARGTAGPIEIEQGILQFRRIIERDGPSRFTSWEMPSHLTISRLGFVRRIHENSDDEAQIFYALPEGWKEMCQGFDPKLIASACVERGIIKPDNDGKFQKRVRLPGMGVRRCYEIHASRLFSDEGTTEPNQVNGHDYDAPFLDGGGVYHS